MLGQLLVGRSLSLFLKRVCLEANSGLGLAIANLNHRALPTIGSVPGSPSCSGLGQGKSRHPLPSYLLNRQVRLRKVRLKEVAHEGQTRRSWRVVLGAPAFEEVSQEQEDDNSQQQSPEMESCPKGSCQGACGCEHGT